MDADGDGLGGGVRTIDFDTLTLATLPGTAVCGSVFSSELVQGTTTSVNTPLQGVTITVDGAEESLFATSDANGDFRLAPCPAGRFFVHIDGRTAEVAGQAIDLGSNPVTIILPFNSPTSQTVVVQAEDFPLNTNLPIRIMLTPSSGDPTYVDADIDMNQNPDTLTVNVTLPTNTAVKVHVWTR